MVCVPFEHKTPRGKIIKGIMCHGPKSKVFLCKICNKEAEKLCDYPISKGKTCDIALCNEHAKPIGINMDLCPIHYGEYKKRKAL